jgi:hypothetical protein
MHHCKKFFIALQDLFAAMQQKSQKPHFLIKNSRLRVKKVNRHTKFRVKIRAKNEKTTRRWFQTTGGRGVHK